jgi:fatty-acid desaturase
MEEDEMVKEACALITNLFLDSQMMHAVYLAVYLVQGDLSITTYYHRLKALFDAFRDVNTHVSD